MPADVAKWSARVTSSLLTEDTANAGISSAQPMDGHSNTDIATALAIITCRRMKCVFVLLLECSIMSSGL